jgi:hypothetical protein
MAFVTMTIPGTLSKSLQAKEMSAVEINKFLLTANVDLFAGRKTAWQNLKLSMQLKTCKGVKVKFHIDNSDPDKKTKIEAVEKAIEKCITIGGLTFPTSTVEIYIHNANQACLGYLLPLRPESKFVIILGTGVLHTTSQLVSTIMRDSCGRMSFSKDITCATTAVIHEFGHCFHQLLNPSQYYVIGQANIMRGKSIGELTMETKWSERHGLTNGASLQAMDDFIKAANTIGKEVSVYAGTHPLEFVAECFAGQIMGIQYEENILNTYVQLGGPPVNGEAPPVKKPAPKPSFFARKK